jgi:hypothetical protein
MSAGRVVLFGVLTWLVPFVVSFGFYDRTGRLAVPAGVFQSVMVVVGGTTGAWLLVRVFRRPPAWPRLGLSVGLLWLGINLALDLLVLVPMTGMSVATYLGEIGLGYAVIPVMAVAFDAVAARPGGPS